MSRGRPVFEVLQVASQQQRPLLDDVERHLTEIESRSVDPVPNLTICDRASIARDSGCSVQKTFENEQT